MSLTALIPILQMAIGPMILVSGVGLLLLSMTNRLGRIVDRSRQLAHELRGAPPGQRATDIAQIDILWRRARIVRAAIAFAVVSMLLAALLIIALFLMAFLDLGVGWPVSTLFVACMACLIAALVFFIWDVNLSLNALRLDVLFFERCDE
jgi:sterol desaturase/sphingolipid hydroxylase (fatty acid hydroxylase superfamily)